jgi:hypothetical protein
MVKVDTALDDDHVWVLECEDSGGEKPVMKASVPRKERPRRLMLNGANIGICRLRKPIVVAENLVSNELFSRKLRFSADSISSQEPSFPRHQLPGLAATSSNLF